MQRVLILDGLQVEEVKRHSFCLAFSSAGPQSQTYYISYDSYTEHLRWHRTASKVLKVLYVFDTLLASIITFLSPHKFRHHVMLMKAGFWASWSRVDPSPLSDCVTESELSRPLVLQPGGAACSAVLQPGPHTPQPQKQLHFTTQRCSSTHQVSFCPNTSAHTSPSLLLTCVFMKKATGGLVRLFSLLDMEWPSVVFAVLLA